MSSGSTSDFLQGLATGETAGGSVVGGLAGGLLLGLIGTGIAYVAQSKPDMDPDQFLLYQDRSDEFHMGYQKGYVDTVHKKKKSSALTGGLIGTAVLVSSGG